MVTLRCVMILVDDLLVVKFVEFPWCPSVGDIFNLSVFELEHWVCLGSDFKLVNGICEGTVTWRLHDPGSLLDPERALRMLIEDGWVVPK